MLIGVVFPTFEIGNDPELIRSFGQAAESLGYSHIVVYDHVLGAHPDRAEWAARRGDPPFPPHTHLHPFHEAIVVMAYLAGATTRIGLMTGVLVLPQRQTALVAKQAAELAVLRPRGLRLGIGTGWNSVEYEALGADFESRGKVIDEQVALMRALWAADLVEFQGKHHRVSNAGINPRPSEPIPIWFGGSSDIAIKRCARSGDGWIPLLGPGATLRQLRDRLYRRADAEERDPGTIGIELFVNFMPGSHYAPHKSPDHNVLLASDSVRWNSKLDDIEDFGGVTHASLMTMDYGLPRPRDHVEAIRLYANAVDVAGRNDLDA